MRIPEDTLVQKMREHLAWMSKASNPTPLDVQLLSVKFNTTVPRVTRALRYLEKLKNEIHRKKNIFGTPVEVQVFPKMLLNTISHEKDDVMNEKDKNSNTVSNNYQFIQDGYVPPSETSYRNMNTNRLNINEKNFDVSIKPILNTTFSADAQNDKNPATNEIGDFLPVIVDYGMLLTYQSQQKNNPGLVVNSVTVKPEAVALIQESLRCFNALDYVYANLNGTQRRVIEGILKGSSPYGRFVNNVKSSAEV